MMRAFLPVLFLALLVAACSDDTTVPSFAGRLEIDIVGVPAGAEAPVTLTAADGDTIAVPRTHVFDLVPPGEYVLRSRGFSHGFGDYYPPSLAQTVTLRGGESRTVTLAYDEIITHGGLVAVAQGIPAEAAATFEVAGPDGFSTTLAQADSLGRVAPGAYTVTGGRTVHGEVVYTAWPREVELEVEAGAWSVATLPFAAGHDVDLDLSIAGVELTQATQREDGTVPLIAGREAYLRVFGVASVPNEAAATVRVAWLQDGVEIATDDLTRASLAAPTGLQRADVGASWNVRVPAARVQPGLSYRVTIDPEGRVPESIEVNNAWPSEGAITVPVVRRDPLRVRLVPVLQNVNGQLGDASPANAEAYVAASRQLLPASDLDVDLHDVYTTSAPPLQSENVNGGWGRVLTELDGLRRVEDNGGRHYYGVVRCAYSSGIAGLGQLGGDTAMGWDAPATRAEVMAHELGHNVGLPHAPCGDPAGIDPAYPYPDGSIGAWGFDVATATVHDPAASYDLMSYCRPRWISDYMYEQVMAYEMPAPAAGARTTCLLVWGRVTGGELTLDPALVVQARPSFPTKPGPYELVLRDASGHVIADIAFAMPVVGDLPEGDSSFAWTIPLPADKSASLARLEVAGPAGRAVRERSAAAKVRAPAPRFERADDLTVRWDGDAYPLVMVRRPSDGRVLAILRGGEGLMRAAPGTLDLVFSDGLGGDRVRATAP